MDDVIVNFYITQSPWLVISNDNLILSNRRFANKLLSGKVPATRITSSEVIKKTLSVAVLNIRSISFGLSLIRRSGGQWATSLAIRPAPTYFKHCASLNHQAAVCCVSRYRNNTKVIKDTHPHKNNLFVLYDKNFLCTFRTIYNI